MKQILIVDDEPSVSEFISRTLTTLGYAVLTASNGLEALAIFKTNPIDLIILDLMMPTMDGIETCRRIRNESIVPILVLTGLNQEMDRVKALKAGADDCLSKPFGVHELMARVQSILRRVEWMSGSSQTERLQYDEIVLDLAKVCVIVKGTPISLTQTEFNLLHFLMRNSEKVMPHQTILKKIWGETYGNESEYLRVYVGRLRRKIEADPSSPKYLHTEFGIGYRFGEKRVDPLSHER